MTSPFIVECDGLNRGEETPAKQCEREDDERFEDTDLPNVVVVVFIRSFESPDLGDFVLKLESIIL